MSLLLLLGSGGVGGVTLSPSGITSQEAFGSSVIVRGVISIAPSSIASQEAFGSATIVRGMIILYPSSISSSEAFGSAVVTGGEILTGRMIYYVRGFSSFGHRRNY